MHDINLRVLTIGFQIYSEMPLSLTPLRSSSSCSNNNNNNKGGTSIFNKSFTSRQTSLPPAKHTEFVCTPPSYATESKNYEPQSPRFPVQQRSRSEIRNYLVNGKRHNY